MINHIRRAAYRVGRILGNIQAVRRGPVAIVKRQERRFVWRTVARILRRFR